MLVLPQWNTLKFFGQWYYTVAENYDYVYRYMIKKHLKKNPTNKPNAHATFLARYHMSSSVECLY